MSLRPGIGALAVPVLKGALAPDGDLSLMFARGDVPETIRSAGKEYPLGRYLRGKLRESLGWENTQPEVARAAISAARAALTEEDLKTIEVSRENQYERARARLKIDRSKRRL